MQIEVTGQHLDVTSALRDYVVGKLRRLERHFDHVTNAHVVLSAEKTRRRAEATINISGGQLFADVEHEDMYAAIDALTDKLDRQILRHKSRRTDHHRASGGLKAQNAEQADKEG